MSAPDPLVGYGSDEQLLDVVLPFVAEGLRLGETVVVVVRPPAEAVLRRGLGADAAGVRWRLPGLDPLWFGRSLAAKKDFVAAQRESGVRTRLVTELTGPMTRTRMAAYVRWEVVESGSSWLCLHDERLSVVDCAGLSPVPREVSTVDSVTRIAEIACELGLPVEERESVVRATAGLGPSARVWRDGGSVVVRIDGADAVGDSWRFADTVAVQGDSAELTFPVTPAWERSLAASAFEQGPQLQVMHEGPDFVVVEMNAAAREFLKHVSPMGRPLRDWAGQFGDAAELTEMFRAVFTSGIPFAGRDMRVRRDSEDMSVNLDLTPWRGGDGEIRGVLATASVVTDLVRAKEDAEARYEQTLDVVGELQRALLPGELPVLPGARIAARYLIAGDEIDAGGDWFDAMPLGDGRVALVVGDVVGHGVGASVSMGQLRTVLWERLSAGVGLAEAVTALDRFAAGVADAHAATVCVVLLDPVSGACEYCTAGHPAPLLVDSAGTTRYLEASGAGPLATGGPVSVAREELPMDAVLLLYSDGILERPGRAPARSTVELAQVAGEARGGDAPAGAVVERVCERTLEVLTRGTGYRDDISLLAVHRVGLPRDVDLRVPVRTASVGVVRRELVVWLAEVHAGENDRFALTHAVSELVTNSVEYAYPPGKGEAGVRVQVRLTPAGEALVTVSDEGRWRTTPEPGRGRGHGLAMAADLADDLELDRRADGTTATLRRRLSRPAQLLAPEVGRGPGPADSAGAPGPGASGPGASGPGASAAEDTGDRGPEEPGPAGSMGWDPRQAFPESAFRVAQHGDTLVVSGPLDVEHAPELRDELLRSTRGGTHGVTVDLTGVDHLSSAAVRVLHEAAHRAATQGERLRLVAPPGSTAQQVLALVGLDGLLRLRGLGR